MNEIKKDIYSTLKKNNLIVWGVVAGSTIITCLALWSNIKMRQEADRYLYAFSSDEKMMPLERIERKSVEHVFKQSHVELFLNSFYGFDQWNYQDKIERALWLVDDTGKDLYYFYKDKGYYNRMIESSSSQSVYNVVVDIDATNNFVVSCTIKINKPNQREPKVYQLKGQGSLEKVSPNYPLNPYGFLILNYREISKTEVYE